MIPGGAAVGILANDFKATGPDTVQFVSNTPPSHGTVSINADGTFTYTPTPGYTGADSFVYTTRNSADPTLTDTAAVNISVGTVVWYVNNNVANGNGTSTSPFNSLAPVNGAGGAGDADAAGSVIYVYSGATYAGGFQLEANQKLIGNGTALVVDTVTLRVVRRLLTGALWEKTQDTGMLTFPVGGFSRVNNDNQETQKPLPFARGFRKRG